MGAGIFRLLTLALLTWPLARLWAEPHAKAAVPLIKSAKPLMLDGLVLMDEADDEKDRKKKNLMNMMAMQKMGQSKANKSAGGRNQAIADVRRDPIVLPIPRPDFLKTQSVPGAPADFHVIEDRGEAKTPAFAGGGTSLPRPPRPLGMVSTEEVSPTEIANPQSDASSSKPAPGGASASGSTPGQPIAVIPVSDDIPPTLGAAVAVPSGVAGRAAGTLMDQGIVPQLGADEQPARERSSRIRKTEGDPDAEAIGGGGAIRGSGSAVGKLASLMGAGPGVPFHREVFLGHMPRAPEADPFLFEIARETYGLLAGRSRLRRGPKPAIAEEPKVSPGAMRLLADHAPIVPETGLARPALKPVAISREEKPPALPGN